MTVATTTHDDQVTDVQLANYAKLIYKVTGIRVSPRKKMLLSNRIRRRLRTTGIQSFEAYYAKLRKLPVDDPEWDAFLQEITTHETYLFRDESHWKWFCNSYLKELADDAAKGCRDKELRIWSAACSTGDEAYTIASCVADRLPNPTTWKIDILGTDIGIDAVKKAKRAVFGKRAMQNVPDKFRRRFFKKQDKADAWSAKPALTQWVRFKTHNLLDRLNEPAFDVIFLKNVLIYFDPNSKKAAIKQLSHVLKAGGVLITGAAEGLGELPSDFERASPWLHRKTAATSKPTVRRGGTR